MDVKVLYYKLYYAIPIKNFMFKVYKSKVLSFQISILWMWKHSSTYDDL